MKKWTVVVEVNEEIGPDSILTQAGIEEWVAGALRNRYRSYLGFRIMETIEAPYGAQHPDGVFIADSSRKGNFRQ